jgi:hypothetical protein
MSMHKKAGWGITDNSPAIPRWWSWESIPARRSIVRYLLPLPQSMSKEYSPAIPFAIFCSIRDFKAQMDICDSSHFLFISFFNFFFIHPSLRQLPAQHQAHGPIASLRHGKISLLPSARPPSPGLVGLVD